MINVYAIVGLVIRVILAAMLWKTGREALRSQTRTLGNALELAAAASVFLGFYMYLFTLIILIRVGIRMWDKRKRGSASWRIGSDTILFLLTLLLFLNGSGAISLDKLIGNI